MKMYVMVLGPIGTNCYLVTDDNGNAVVIDPADNAEEILEQARRTELTIKAIMLTHGHPDHIGGVQGVKKAFPDAPVIIGLDDMYRLPNAQELIMWPENFNLDNYYNLSSDREVVDGDVIDVGDLHFKVIHTPGHTEGGVCYLIDQYLFTGDTLFQREVGRTDLAGGDYKQLLASLRRLAELEGEYVVLPGHGEYSAMSVERKYNPYMREAMK